jgi:hypothetical protein
MRIQEQTIERLKQLEEAAKTKSTRSAHQATKKSFERFCEADLGIAPVQARPLDVIAWLMSLDKRARTVVHVIDCPGKLSCACPRRQAAKSVESTVGKLRAVFNGHYGMTADYNPRSAVGNPCASTMVANYVRDMGKEQTGAGMRAKQAVNFSERVFNQLVEELATQAQDARESGDDQEAYEALRDALLFTLMFHSLDRAVNICELTWNQVEITTDLNGDEVVTIACGMDKTAGPGARPRVNVVREAGPLTASELFRAFSAFLESADIDYGTRKGCMFRASSKVGVGNKHVSTQVMARRLEKLTEAIGIGEEGVTLHSYRGSGAKAALLAGYPEEVVMDLANWSSEDMMAYYTDLRKMIAASARKSK